MQIYELIHKSCRFIKAGAELCQAQDKLSLSGFEVRLPANLQLPERIASGVGWWMGGGG